MDKYTTLYEIGITVNNGKASPMVLSNDDIISLSIINDYDYAIFPIIRLRLFIDLDKYTYINEDPNNLSLTFNCMGGVYKINQTDNGTTQVKIISTGSADFGINGILNGYVETKNNAYSKYDNYQMGTKRDSSLNTNNKIPLTVFCYDAQLVRAFKRKVPGIYKNTSLEYIINDMFEKCGIAFDYLNISRIDNSEKFDQVLIPNLSLMEALSYLDTYYGLYEEGTQIFCDTYSRINMGSATPGIGSMFNVRVSSYKAGDTFSGVMLNGKDISYQTPDASVVIKSQTDLEQATNAQIFGSINVETMEAVSTYLEETFKGSDVSNITTPDIIHKSKNKFIPTMYRARLNDRNTRIDLSLNGFVISPQYSVTSGFTFTFDNPIRGVDIGRAYRSMNATHTLTNIGSGLFDIQSTFQLC